MCSDGNGWTPGVPTLPPVLRSGSERGIHFGPEVHFGKIDCDCRILNSFDCTVASLQTKSKSLLHRTGVRVRVRLRYQLSSSTDVTRQAAGGREGLRLRLEFNLDGGHPRPTVVAGAGLSKYKVVFIPTVAGAAAPTRAARGQPLRNGAARSRAH